MIYLDWLLTLSLVLVAPIVSFAVSKFQRLISASTQRAQQRIADLTANLSEVLQGQRVVKSFGREEFEVARFRNRNDDFFGAYMKLTQFIQTQPLVISTIMVAAVVAIMWLSVREVLRRTARHREGLHVLGAAGQPDESDESGRGLLRRHQQGHRRCWARLRAARLAGRSARTAGRGARCRPCADGSNTDDVTFRYKSDEPPALRHVERGDRSG